MIKNLEQELEEHQKWQVDAQQGRRLELHGANLAGVDLRAAKIYRAKFVDVDLQGADLRGASFSRSDLQNVRFDGAQLEKTDFGGTMQTGCSYKSGKASQSNFAHAVLKQCNFDYADCEHANLAKSSCESMSGRGMRLRNANLLRWTVIGASLSGIDLSGSDLFRARFKNTDLRAANLSETMLVRTRLDGILLHRAHGLPLLVDGCDSSNLDFSVQGDGSQPGSLDTLALQLGGENGKPTWGSATIPELYAAFLVEDGASTYFSLERRADRHEIARVIEMKTVGRSLQVDYHLADARFEHPGLIEPLIVKALLVDLQQERFRGKVNLVEFTNIDNQRRTTLPYS